MANFSSGTTSSSLSSGTDLVDALKGINQVLAVGSVDGVLTAAAMLRLIGGGDPANVGLVFCQAFTVDKVDVGAWAPDRKVALVDLAVNNRDKEMTRSLVTRLREAGHSIVAVVDEHDRADWLGVLGSFEGLLVEPQSQNEGMLKSSGAVLKAALESMGVALDAHTDELLSAADAADRMDFTSRFGGMVNQAVKSAIQDDTRRVALARWLAAGNSEPSPEIQGWITEYSVILANHAEILAARQDLGDGIIRVAATGKAVDMTTLMSTLYREGAKVVALEGEAFVPATKTKQILVAYGTDIKSLDLMSIIKGADVLPLGGFAQKVNVALDDESKATEAIRATLQAAAQIQ